MLVFNVKIKDKLNIKFQGQCIRMCVKFKIWGYGVGYFFKLKSHANV